MSQIIRFKKIVPEGKALGDLEGKATFAIGPLPGELAEISVSRQRRRYNEAVLREILEPSPHRHDPAEDHYLSCSPWQGVDYDYQVELKTAMIEESFRQQKLMAGGLSLVKAQMTYSYRNRLDFTLTRIDDRLQLAFHRRGSWNEFLPLPSGCKLGSNAMNRAALQLLDALNHHDVPIYDATLTVRQSQSTGQLLLILTTSLIKYDWSALGNFTNANLAVATPLPGSGAPGPVTYQQAEPVLTETIGGLDLQYPFNSFFQTNIDMFNLALNGIQTAAAKADSILELYCGVGAIGLPLARQAQKVTGIEIAPSSIEYAELNARANGVTNYHGLASPAEKIDSALFRNIDTLIVDPPRAGLHPRIIKWIQEASPQRLIYLSCNPITQARDVALLQSSHKLTDLTAYDFYPQTLHMESLAVMERR